MKVLLVVDMQKGFINTYNNVGLVSKINNLIENGKYDKLIFTKFKNDTLKNAFYQEKIGWNGLKTHEEQELVVNVPKGSIVLEKYGYGLERKDLEYINSLSAKEMDIFGVKAEACVYAIALQLWDTGIYPNILINYVVGNKDMKNVYKKQFGVVDEIE